MQVIIPPQIQSLIEDRIRSGQYARAEDVVVAAILSLEQQDRSSKLSPTELGTLYPAFAKKIREGLAAADAGHLSDGDEFFDELERETPPSQRR